ncbi:MAG TPA: hypothetical protein GX508_03970 [Coprothermobacter sp.]|nr:hypothetical protein [Coprothermobacter sp.]
MNDRPDLAKEILEKKVKEKNYPRCKRLLATLYLRTDPKKAEALYEKPSNMWEEVYLGDIRYYFLNDVGGALDAWQSAFEKVDWATAQQWDNPARNLLKRLYMVTKDSEFLERWAELDVDNFKQSEMADYIKLLYKKGEKEKAQETLNMCMYLYREDPILTKVAMELDLEIPPYKKKKPEIENVTRKPLNAGLLKEDTNPETLIKAVHELHPDAVITLASSVLTIMQGTLMWAGTFKPCRLARTLGPFTEHAKGPLVHFYTHPIVADWKMQAYLELTGTVPVLFGALVAAIGKLFKQSGWFYKVIGPAAKAVDSNKIAPYDSCLVPGPLDSKGFTSRLCSQNIPFAIVDVNSVFGAEVVECCPQLDKKWIEGTLSDNPAGNDESMTPIVLLWKQEHINPKEIKHESL